MKTLILTGAILLALNSFGQIKERTCKTCPSTNDISNELTNLPEIQSFDGTYQLIVKQGDSFALTDAFFLHIENERKANEDVTIDLGNGRKLFILSQTHIQNASFTPFTSPYKIY